MTKQKYRMPTYWASEHDELALNYLRILGHVCCIDTHILPAGTHAGHSDVVLFSGSGRYRSGKLLSCSTLRIMTNRIEVPDFAKASRHPVSLRPMAVENIPTVNVAQAMLQLHRYMTGVFRKTYPPLPRA